MAIVLVVDDSKLIVETLKATLKEMGHQVVTAMDAYQAVMVASQARPALVTIDFQMPAGSGTSLYKRLRDTPALQTVPVIFISGVDAGALAPVISADPLARFVKKPVDAAKLKDVIKELLDHARAASGFGTVD